MKTIEDKLSDYLDGELTAEEHAEVEAHLAECAECARALADLRRIATTAASLPSKPPARDLWNGVAARIGAAPAPASKRFWFTMPELAAASLLIAMLSGATVALLLRNTAPNGSNTAAGGAEPVVPAAAPALETDPGDQPQRANASDDPRTITFADAQYDAAVGDLERALAAGRGRLDESTIAVIEQNLSIIDRAIAEARQALETDPSDSYLTGHLMQARKRKLDLLRRTALLAEAN